MTRESLFLTTLPPKCRILPDTKKFLSAWKMSAAAVGTTPLLKFRFILFKIFLLECTFPRKTVILNFTLFSILRLIINMTSEIILRKTYSQLFAKNYERFNFSSIKSNCLKSLCSWQIIYRGWLKDLTFGWL